MAKRTLLVEQHLHRAFMTNFWIVAQLEDMGHEVRVSFTGAQLARNVIDFKPHVAYFPWMTANTSLKKRAPQVPIVNGFQEQLIMLGNPSEYLLRKLRLSDYVLAWGHRLKRHLEHSGIGSSEPPRVFRRLFFLRGWSHDKTKQVLSRGPGAGSSDGVGSRARAQFAVVGHRVDRG